MCADPDHTIGPIGPFITGLEEEVDPAVWPAHPAVTIAEQPFADAMIEVPENLVEPVSIVVTADHPSTRLSCWPQAAPVY